MLHSIANDFGNVDVRSTLPKRYIHIPGKRLQPLCRKLGIKYAGAMTGFEKSGRYWKAIIDGIVVSARSAAKLNDAIEARAKRAIARPKRLVKKSLKQLHEERLAELGIAPDSRTAKWLTRGLIDEDQARLIAFKTEFRHERSNYDELLGDGYERDFARTLADAKAIPSDWSQYFATYSFPHPDVAEALARTLASASQSHPIWFCEAVIAVRRFNVDLATLSYGTIRNAILRWRRE